MTKPWARPLARDLATTATSVGPGTNAKNSIVKNKAAELPVVILGSPPNGPGAQLRRTVLTGSAEA